MRVNESEMLALIERSKTVFLLEPPYRRKYLPLGLAKIASYIKANGGQVLYGRAYSGEPCDLICVSSLFTYESAKVLNAIREARKLAPHTPILVGGIYASLMPAHVEEHTGGDVFVFAGFSLELDRYVPDYSIDWAMDEKWRTFSFTFTSRGCVNNCPYCAVKRIEPQIFYNPNWRNHIAVEKPHIMISDNNLSAADNSHLFAVLHGLIESKKRVVFDNGFDCKHITPELAETLARVKFYDSGMRLAFDRIEEDGIFQPAIERLRAAGIPKGALMAYVLFNFNDTPQEADYRMRECVRVGCRPYPQQFTPLNKTERTVTFVGKHWTENLLRHFRFFWLMAGYYGKMTFEQYIHSELPQKAHKQALSDQDLAAWYAK